MTFSLLITIGMILFFIGAVASAAVAIWGGKKYCGRASAMAWLSIGCLLMLSMLYAIYQPSLMDVVVETDCKYWQNEVIRLNRAIGE